VTRRGAIAISVLAAASLLGRPERVSSAPADARRLGVKIIGNSEGIAPRLTREDLARIFLGKKTLWDSGARIMPAMLDEETGPMQPFVEGVLKKSVEQYRAYWKRLLFSGGGTAPRTFRNSAQVLEFVAKNPGAIGVVESSAADDRVKVVDVEG
jgi:ABC-type phosphate transport system substrate-binding protein